MNPLFSKVLVDIARKRIEAKQEKNRPATPSQVAKLVNNIKVEIKHAVKEYLFIAVGVFSAGFGLKGFLLPNKFIDVGATGISLLLENTTTISII